MKNLNGIAVIFSLLLLTVILQVRADDIWSVTELKLSERDKTTDLIIGQASIRDSQDGVILKAPVGDNMAVVRQLLEADKRSASLAFIAQSRGEGRLSVVDVNQSSSDGEKIIAAHFDLTGSQENRFELSPASRYISSESVIEIHLSASDGQELAVESVALESLKAEPQSREIIRYRHFPSDQPMRTVFYYYYQGPLYVYRSPWAYVVYDGWWDWTVYTTWRRIYHQRIIRWHPEPVYLYLYPQPRYAHIQRRHGRVPDEVYYRRRGQSLASRSAPAGVRQNNRPSFGGPAKTADRVAAQKKAVRSSPSTVKKASWPKTKTSRTNGAVAQRVEQSRATTSATAKNYSLKNQQTRRSSAVPSIQHSTRSSGNHGARLASLLRKAKTRVIKSTPAQTTSRRQPGTGSTTVRKSVRSSSSAKTRIIRSSTPASQQTRQQTPARQVVRHAVPHKGSGQGAVLKKEEEEEEKRNSPARVQTTRRTVRQDGSRRTANGKIR